MPANPNAAFCPVKFPELGFIDTSPLGYNDRLFQILHKSGRVTMTIRAARTVSGYTINTYKYKVGFNALGKLTLKIGPEISMKIQDTSAPDAPITDVATDKNFAKRTLGTSGPSSLDVLV